MQLGCTQKALNYFKVPSKPSNPELDPLFTWSCAVTTINRRNTVLVLNDATLTGFLIYGLTVTHCKHLDDVIKDGIRHMLETECIAPEVIDLYFASCGESITYTKPSGHFMQEKLRATLNEVKNLRSVLADHTLYQPLFVRRLNSTYTSHQARKHFQPRIELKRQFHECFRLDNITRVKMAVLSVSLRGLDATRTLRVPVSLPLYQLHHAIQKSYRWLDTHPHQFITEEEETVDLLYPQKAAPADSTSYQNSYLEIEKQVTVEEVFENRQKLFYLYDYRNFWIHEINFLRFEDVFDEKPDYCLEAVGEAPPENITSIFDFHRFLQIYHNPHHEKYELVTEWAAEQNWLPLQLKTINHNLSMVMDGWYL